MVSKDADPAVYRATERARGETLMNFLMQQQRAQMGVDAAAVSALQRATCGGGGFVIDDSPDIIIR